MVLYFNINPEEIDFDCGVLLWYMYAERLFFKFFTRACGG